MKPKVNIIGVNSVIGSNLYRHLMPSCMVNGTYFNTKLEPCNLFLDITNRASLMEVLPRFDCSIVILLSAIKDVKKCEENYEFAYRMNTKPVQDIIEIIQEKGLDIRFIYFSSDYVFEGSTGNYRHDSPLNPKTNYGRTKAAAERLLNTSKIDYKIIRTSAIMGPRAPFFSWLVEAIKKGEGIRLFKNVYFTPTPINFLSGVMEKVINDYYTDSLSVPAILHIVGEQRLSRFEFGTAMYDILQGTGRLIPEEKDLSGDIFQHDLSMEQSSYVKKLPNKSLFEYLKLIL